MSLKMKINLLTAMITLLYAESRENNKKERNLLYLFLKYIYIYKSRSKFEKKICHLISENVAAPLFC